MVAGSRGLRTVVREKLKTHFFPQVGKDQQCFGFQQPNLGIWPWGPRFLPRAGVRVSAQAETLPG